MSFGVPQGSILGPSLLKHFHHHGAEVSVI